VVHENREKADFGGVERAYARSTPPKVELNRITFDPNIMGGRACIRGMRVTVSLIVNLVANGMTSAASVPPASSTLM